MLAAMCLNQAYGVGRKDAQSAILQTAASKATHGAHSFSVAHLIVAFPGRENGGSHRSDAP
ncbi:hypothetical protein GGD41_002304 [Paraburkholderia bryophila]|uniref:Uncharacterized protein n=1 Tax=Paraburkholderia bryophila TaxID=420952 RepID=A0A7Y9W7J6_9BURK|nr:hypothetical protein [Paraburkholderia bryophila]NYH26597.1 hypothetical protein [Paraburkholderia bryophila]